MSRWLAFGLAAVLAAVITPVIRRLALRLRAVDDPHLAPDRKLHRTRMPLLGGTAIYFAFFGGVALLAAAGVHVSGTSILPKHLIGLFIGATIIMLGGFLDDRYRLRPLGQFAFPFLATLVVIASGIGIRTITNPFGGVIHLDQISLPVLTYHGLTYHITLWSDLFTLVWMLGMSYTTKFLDGLDGLVAGVTGIGGLAVAVLSLRPPVLQPETATLAVLLTGAASGFLPWNWHPARIFLGEGGSLMTGYLLGALAIVAGSKVATALLIMGIPILDVAWVIVRRWFVERRSPFSGADRKHLHFRLLDVGFSHRGAVLFLFALTAIASATTIVFHGLQKVVALGVLTIVMVVLASLLVVVAHRRHVERPRGSA